MSQRYWNSACTPSAGIKIYTTFMALMNLITFGDSDDIDSMGCTFQSKSDYVNRGTHVLTGAKLHLIPFLRQI